MNGLCAQGTHTRYATTPAIIRHLQTFIEKAFGFPVSIGNHLFAECHRVRFRDLVDIVTKAMVCGLSTVTQFSSIPVCNLVYQIHK